MTSLVYQLDEIFNLRGFESLNVTFRTNSVVPEKVVSNKK